jgi:hypothetical protein
MAAIRKDEVQEIIADIRDMLELRGDPPESELKRLAQRYTSTIQQVNSLLKTCLDLVERGLKSEAIMRADEAGLLETVSILDFPEQPVWVDYLTQFGFPTPPAVDQFATRQLNSCYAPARRLEPLYRLNRRHALANSPLRVRLGVMRRIHRMEEANAKEASAKQVELFELERVKGIRKELADATENRDLRRLTLLQSELSGKDWFKAPEAALLRNVSRVLKQEEARLALLRMQSLAADLQNVWSAQDVLAGRRIREQWETCQAKAQLTEQDPLMIDTRAAFEWLSVIDKEEQAQAHYEQQIASLREALDQRQPREALELLEHSIEMYGDGVPEPLLKRLRVRYDELDTEAHRRNVRRLVVTVFSVISVAALAFFVIQNRSFNNRVSEHVTAMTSLLEQGDVESAESYVESLKGEQTDMLTVPQIQVLRVNVEQARRDEDKRVDAFKEGVLRIQEQTPLAAGLAETKQLIQDLDALNAVGAVELNEVEKLRDTVDKRTVEIQAQVDTAFAEELKLAADELKTYEDNGVMDIASLVAFKNRFEALAARKEISPELLSGAAGPKELSARIDLRIQGMSEQTRREQMFALITDAVGSVPNYRAALDAFAKALPRDPVAIRFEGLLQSDADLWLQVDVQNQFVSTHAVDCTTLSPMDARKYVAEADAFLASSPAFPKRDELLKIRNYLEFVGARIDAAGEPILANVQDMIDRSKMEGVYVVRLKTGTRHYTNVCPQVIMLNQKKRVTMKAVPDWTVAVGLREPVNPTLTFELGEVDVQLQGNANDWKSPEWILLTEMKDALLTINDQNWERVLLQLLERVATEQRQDPIFRYVYTDGLLRVLAVGSPAIQEKHEITLKRLSDLQLGSINPFNPEDSATNMRRRDAEAVLQKLSDPREIADDVIKARDAASKLSISGRYRWIGWLHRETTGWTCASSRAPSVLPEGDLFVFTKGTTDTAQFHKIGTTRGMPPVTQTAVFMVEGLPIYLYEP